MISGAAMGMAALRLRKGITMTSPSDARRTVLAFLLALPLAAGTVRIIQTNSAGDDVSIIDPATNKVVGVINGIEVNHGAAVGSRRKPLLHQQ